MEGVDRVSAPPTEFSATAGTGLVLAKAEEIGRNVSYGEAFRMASIVMSCHHLTKDGGPRTKEAYEALLGEVLAGTDPVLAKAKELERQASLLDACGMAAIAMSCYLLTQDGSPRTEGGYEALLGEVLAGTDPVLAKAEELKRSILLLDAFRMAAKAMGCHLSRSDGSPRTKEAYEALLGEILAGVGPVLDKAEEDGRIVSMGDAFDAVAKKMSRESR